MLLCGKKWANGDILPGWYVNGPSSTEEKEEKNEMPEKFVKITFYNFFDAKISLTSSYLPTLLDVPLGSVSGKEKIFHLPVCQFLKMAESRNTLDKERQIS